MPQAAERPFEGRERELESLIERWQRALEGRGQIATVSGAPGIGKSRLIEVFADRTAGQARALLVCRCVKLRRFTAFSPFVDLLRRLEGARSPTGHPDDGRDSEDRRRATGGAGRPDDATADPEDATEDRLRATLIARLSALVAPRPQRRTAALNLNPEGRARKTLEELLALFSESAKRLPVLLVIEDLDWADPSTLALLELLAQRRLHVPWMTVLTFTPRFEAPWAHRAHVMDLELARLTRQQEEAVLERLTAGGTLDPTLRREIIARADGVPLFLEEQARLIRQLDDGGEERPDILPTILKHWLSARLERLGAAGDLAQSASVVGEELSRAHLTALSNLEAPDLERALERLVEAGILVRPEAIAEFAFSHSLVHEAIHDAVPEGPRREAHRRMAEILSESASDAAGRHAGALAGSDLERIAYHYSEAGMPIEAAVNWRDAAQHAVRTSANLEAAERAGQGLMSLDSVANSEQRRALEIELQIVLGAALGTAKGFAAAEAVAAYDQALELVWQTPRAADHFDSLQELTSYYLSRGHVATAHEAAAKALKALDRGDLEAMPIAQRSVGFAKLLQGDFTGAEVALEKSLAPFAVHRSQLYAMPPALGIPMAEKLSHLSLIEWFLGRPSRALKQSTDSLTLARRCNDPYSRVFTVFRASYLHVFRREPVATRELAHELVGLANRHGYLFFIAAGMFLEGQALAAQGRAAEGLQMMSGGLDGVWASGMEVGRPRNLALLAEACGRSELYEQGLSLIKEGIAAVEITGEGHYEAELHRIQGELLRHSGGDEEEIEECFLEALGVARRQGSAALELRAATSLSRLRRAQDKSRQARELLAEVYGRFDEGFDTADLKEAKELLDELS